MKTLRNEETRKATANEFRTNALNALANTTIIVSEVFSKANTREVVQLDFSKTSNRVSDRLQIHTMSNVFDLWLGDNVTSDTTSFKDNEVVNTFKSKERHFIFKEREQLENALNELYKQFSKSYAKQEEKKTETSEERAKQASKTKASKAKRATKAKQTSELAKQA